jgi:hypothetical protein
LSLARLYSSYVLNGRIEELSLTRAERSRNGNVLRRQEPESSCAYRKEMTMSNQPQYENQQPETVTPEELRQSILAELEASKQEHVDLSDEQLMEIAGGTLSDDVIRTSVLTGGGAALGAFVTGIGGIPMHPGAGAAIGASAGLATSHLIDRLFGSRTPQPEAEPGHVELGPVQGHTGTGHAPSGPHNV